MAQAPRIEPAHVRDLLAAAEASRNPTRNAAMLRLVAETGMRPAEVARLTWSAVAGPDGALAARCNWQTAKGGNRRDVPLSPATTASLAMLYARAAGRARPQDPVFVSEQRDKFTAATVTGLVRDLARSAGVRASAYSLRHLALAEEARAVIAAGGHGGDLLAFTGHKALSSVQGYLDAEGKVRRTCDEVRAERCAAY